MTPYTITLTITHLKMLAFAGVVGYCAVSAYNRSCAAKKVLSRTTTDGYDNVMVIYKSRWLCPNLEVTVIGFKDKYINDSDRNKLLLDALSSTTPTDIIDGLRQFKSETVMEATAYGLASGTSAEKDGHVLHKERNWVLPALMPGGLSVFKYKRSPTTNELTWNGHCRTWEQGRTTATSTNITYDNTSHKHTSTTTRSLIELENPFAKPPSQ